MTKRILVWAGGLAMLWLLLEWAGSLVLLWLLAGEDPDLPPFIGGDRALGSSLLAAQPAAGGKNQQGAIESGGRERTWEIHLPPSYEREQSLPVVLAFHGGGGTGSGMRRLTGLDAVSDREGFLVVYPDGVNHQWNDGRAEVDPGVDDVAFVSALIDHLVEQYKADRGRIYATGISNGALFSFRLAGDLSDKIAAIAPVGALMGEALSRRASPAEPMPVLLIHGTQDPLVPWDGGDVQVFRRKRGRVLSASATVAFWVKHNGCAPIPVITYEPDQDPTDGTKVRREEYRSGKDGSEVLLYAVEGGGHTWPGGWQYLPERIIGKTCRDLQASEVIWEFFKRYGKGKEGERGRGELVSW